LCAPAVVLEREEQSVDGGTLLLLLIGIKSLFRGELPEGSCGWNEDPDGSVSPT
jgi:hypothetical protein